MASLLRHLISLPLVLLGTMLVSGVVDITPMIGSPQFDYPGFDIHKPFWPQLAITWIGIGGGGALLAALGVIILVHQRQWTQTLRSTALLGLALFVLVGGLRLAMFLAWGPMVSLDVHQSIYGLSAINGLISSAAITTTWCLLNPAWHKLGADPLRRAAVALVAAATGFAVLLSCTAYAADLSPLPVLAYWWQGILITSLAAALVAALTRRKTARAA